jgi:D-tyrosyl-tRNA(Tyr) deacylase
MAVVLVQRVRRASVRLPEGEERSIGRGLLVYVGFQREDGEEVIPKIVRKILNLRIIEDEAGKMNLSVMDVGGEVLLVPNFTLAGDARKGNRPSFGGAKPPDEAREMFLKLFKEMASYTGVRRGEFGAHMLVSSTNDGPVNIVLSF